ncbi:hypothetical protein ABTM57_19670, partial [Acinetobacter baumannii]
YNVHWFLVGRDRAVLERFFEAVCAFVPTVESHVVVYSHGRFLNDASLAEDLKGQAWERLVMDADMQERLMQATLGFFEQKELYASHGLAWR